ncbi:MAG: AraC family transcriptional regulator [Saonia sp.]
MKTIPILHIGQFEEEESLTDFYSNDLQSHLKKNEKIFYKPHRHNFFLCVLFTKGSGTHEIDFNTYTIQAGSVFFLKPGQTHYWKFDDTPRGYIFFHTQDFYELCFSEATLARFPFYYSHKNPPHLTLTSDELLLLEPLFQEINLEYHRNLIYKKHKLAGLIHLAYIDLARFYVTFEPSEQLSSSVYLRTLSALESSIDQFYKTEKSAKFYANELHISTKHLNRITKTTLNKTTTELITERVLLEAKRLIVHSENSLSAISEILGYGDYAYFSRVFKSKTNSTPLVFKRSYRSF